MKRLLGNRSLKSPSESFEEPAEELLEQALDEPLTIGSEVVYIQDLSGKSYTLVENDGADAKISYTDPHGETKYKDVDTDDLVTLETFKKLKGLTDKKE